MPRLGVLPLVTAAIATGLAATHLVTPSTAATADDSTPTDVAGVLQKISVRPRVGDRAFVVKSSSMEPTLHCKTGGECLGATDDRILVRPYRRSREPTRGDIVAFTTPPGAKVACGAGGTFVQRIVGLPGERLEFRVLGKFPHLFVYVFVNGRRLHEAYVPPSRRETHVHRPTTLRTGHYWVLGDNRANSCGSNAWGSLPGKRLIGRAIAVYWPPARAQRLGPD
jgi:signal peptidase I